MRRSKYMLRAVSMMAIYGVAPGAPIAMNVTITDGLVSEAEAVYLP